MQSTGIYLTPTARKIVQTMLYFDIFSHPLTAQEIIDTANLPGVSSEEVLKGINELVTKGLLVKEGDFYSTQAAPEWVERRQEYAQRAEKYLNIAHKMGKLIGAFPFVRAVMVSGSLSKGVMPADGDIDYFIVTAPGKLWLARTMLVVFKKIFLFNSKKYFCVNYFVDEEHLVIDEKNLFTATEVVTLIPVYGKQYYDRFLEANQWSAQFYPNYPARSVERVPESKSRHLKSFSEWVLAGRLGNWLDKKCMSTTIGHWNRKFKLFSKEDFDIALKSRSYVSKHHPQHFQAKVLNKFSQNIKNFEASAGVVLD